MSDEQNDALRDLDEKLRQTAEDIGASMLRIKEKQAQERGAFLQFLLDLAKRIESGESLSAVLIVETENKLSSRAYPAMEMAYLIGLLEISKYDLMHPMVSQESLVSLSEPAQHAQQQPVVTHAYKGEDVVKNYPVVFCSETTPEKYSSNDSHVTCLACLAALRQGEAP